MFKTIAVQLRLNHAQFTTGLGVAAGQAKAFGRELTGAGDAGEKSLRKVGTAGMIVGGVMVAGLGLAARAAMQFEQELSNLAAVTGATGDQLGALRQQALDAGQATVFSAKEAALAQVELAKAGVETADILGGALEGALDLAAAGGLELGQAATFAANAMNTFGLAGADVPRIADALAAGANKSAADVDDMGLALQQAGLVADQTGLSMQETVGVLSLFAQAGLRGSDAGTSLKTALLRLNPTTREAREAMRGLGLDFYDAEGNFIGIEAAAGQLQQRLGGLTVEQQNATLATIFGQDAIRSGTLLMKAGADGVAEWTDAVSESGYAADLARQKTDNLAGDLEQLRGSIETNLIEGGSMATGALRGLAQAATTVVTGFSALPGPLQGAAVGFTGIVGTAVLLAGTIATLAPKVRELQSALMDMGTVGQFVGRNLGSIAVGAGIAGAALLGLSFLWGEHAKKAAEAAAGAKRFEDALRAMADGAEDSRGAIIAERLAHTEGAEALEQHADLVGAFNDAIINGQDGLTHMISLLAASGGRVDAWAESMRNGEHQGDAFVQALLTMIDAGHLDSSGLLGLLETTRALNREHGTGSDAARRQKVFTEELAAEQGEAQGAAQGLAGAQGDLGFTIDEATGEIQEQKSALQELQDKQRELFDPLFAYMQANLSNVEAQRKLDEATLTYLDTLNRLGPEHADTIAASHDLESAQLGLYQSALDTDSAMAALADQVASGALPMDEAKAAIDRWVSSGRISQTEAENLRTKLFLLTLQAQEYDGDYTAQVIVQGMDNAYAAFGELMRMGRAAADAWRLAFPQAPQGVAPKFGQAKGGVVDYYASGGIRERHVAQIAPAGSWRVWAEPETGGEAYIPLGASNRGRSQQVWLETGRRIGMLDSARGSGMSSTATVVHHHTHHNRIDMSGMVGDRRGLAKELRAILVELEHA